MLRDSVCFGLRFPLGHNPDQRFRTRCADKDLPVFTQFIRKFFDHVLYGLILFPARFIGNTDIKKGLRIFDHEGTQFRKALVLAHNASKKFNSGHHAIAGLSKVTKNNMAGLFPSELIIMGKHLFKDVTIAYTGLHGTPAMFLHGLVKAYIAHDRCDKNLILEFSPLHQIKGTDEHDLVPIKDFAPFVDSQATVCITVIGNATVRSHFDNLLLKGFQMGGPAAIINVDAIGLVINGNHLGSQKAQDGRGHLTVGPVGTVHDHLESIQFCIGTGHNVLDIFHGHIRFLDDAADRRSCQGLCVVNGLVHNGFNFVFHGIGKLETGLSKKLDAIIFKGIVGGRNDNTSAGAQFSVK